MKGAQEQKKIENEDRGRPVHRVGVLLVHGIGRQRPGDTLLGFGEPIFQWTQRWLEGAGSQRDGFSHTLTIERATLLRPDSTDPGAPPHAELVAKITDGDEHLEIRWLLAESWWAGDFPSPSFRSVATWTLGVGPWLIQRHFDRAALQFDPHGAVESLTDPRPGESATATVGKIAATALWGVHLFALERLLKWVPRFISLVIGGIVGLLAQILLLVLLILGIVPRFRSAVARVQTAFADSIGDSYVLLISPFRFATMVGQVKSDLRWLATRSEAIGIVAHSQGSVIAHRALQEGPPAQVRAFITLGSALAKLHLLQEALASRRSLLFASLLRLLTTAVLVASLVVLSGTSNPEVGFLAAAGALISTMWLAISAAVGFERIRPLRSEDILLPRLGVANELSWLDFYGSADPVPEGPLPETNGVKTNRVFNTGSILRDHTTYWRNSEGFLLPVASALAGLGEWDDFASLTRTDRVVVERAQAEREARVAAISASRWATIPLAAIVSAGLGFEGLRFIGGLLGGPVLFLIRLFSAESALAAARALNSRPVGLVLGLLAALLVVLLVRWLWVVPAWIGWTREAAARFAARQHPRPAGSVRLFSLAVAAWVLASTSVPFASALVRSHQLNAGHAAAGIIGFAILIPALFSTGTDRVFVDRVIPEKGAPGTRVTIRGTGFVGVMEVSFGESRADFRAPTAWKIVTAVPLGARTGTIRVTTREGRAESWNEFVVPD
jgi:hypothetical protein